MEDYAKALQDFVTRLTEEQRASFRALRYRIQPIASTGPEDLFASYESGRKYDKIVIHTGASNSARYFVKRSTGDIYGAKSWHAPNLHWWFGDIYNAEKWDWSDFHGRPVTDDRIRAVKQYAGYTHYIKI